MVPGIISQMAWCTHCSQILFPAVHRIVIQMCDRQGIAMRIKQFPWTPALLAAYLACPISCILDFRGYLLPVRWIVVPVNGHRIPPIHRGMLLPTVQIPQRSALSRVRMNSKKAAQQDAGRTSPYGFHRSFLFHLDIR
jgi:hypothetical protein